MAKNILIIDDDPNIRQYLEKSLRLKGYRVRSFTSAEPGMDELLTGRYHLALVDILLPGLSGLEVCRALRTYPTTRNLPVVIMTAFYRDARHMCEARDEYGATDYLLKPFSLAALYGKVEELTGASKDPKRSGMPEVAGPLAETPFARLLHNLYTLKATGLLYLEREGAKKVIYIREGYPIFVRSNLVRECLGQMLARTGRLTAEQCAESLNRAKESGRLQGTVLVEMDLLTPQDLQRALKTQVFEKVLEVFSWTDGVYRFNLGKSFKQGITAITLSPAALILHGIRRYYHENRIREILLAHRNRYLSQAENPHYRFQEMELSARDARLFAKCRGDRTLEELAAEKPLIRREAELLLAALLIAGMVKSTPTPAPTEADDARSAGEETTSGALRYRFLNDYRRMMSQNYFELFNVPPDSSRETVRKAYFTLARKYHPDHFFQKNLSPDFQKKISELFQRINEAHGVLTDPKRRAEYLKALENPAPETTTAAAADILQAEVAYQKGTVLLRQGQFRRALESLGWAIKLCPDEPEYLTHYAWALHKAHPDDAGKTFEARSTLLHSADLDPRLDLTHLYLGSLHKMEGRDKEAERSFENAIQCNPNCTEALRELRLYNLRRNQATKRKGLRDLIKPQ